MERQVIVLKKGAPVLHGYISIDVTSHSESPYVDLSPFYLGPCNLYWGLSSKNVENAWQYSKVYPEHILGTAQDEQVITDAWFSWALQGFQRQRADRYPKGKGAVPKFTYWAGRTLGYVEARKIVYAPLYSKSALVTSAYTDLCKLLIAGVKFALVDFDGYNSVNSFEHVLHDANRKMGHAFVLRAMLEEPDYMAALVAEHDSTLAIGGAQ